MFNADANNIYSLYTEATESKNQESQVIVHRDGTKQWFLNGKLHRTGAPATMWPNGINFWYQHGKLHRDDAPAIECANGDNEWWQHDKRHRDNGAAIEYANGNKAWYLNGEHYADVNQWAQAALKMHNKPHAADDAERFLRVILTKEDLL